MTTVFESSENNELLNALNMSLEEEKKSEISLSEKMTKKNSKGKCGYGKCKRKIKSYDVKCKCRIIFCAEHRNDLKHECMFDYITENKKNLSATIKQVIGSKVDKI